MKKSQKSGQKSEKECNFDKELKAALWYDTLNERQEGKCGFCLKNVSN